jgi:hypothetical protein
VSFCGKEKFPIIHLPALRWKPRSGSDNKRSDNIMMNNATKINGKAHLFLNKYFKDAVFTAISELSDLFLFCFMLIMNAILPYKTSKQSRNTRQYYIKWID